MTKKEQVVESMTTAEVKSMMEWVKLWVDGKKLALDDEINVLKRRELMRKKAIWKITQQELMKIRAIERSMGCIPWKF